MVLLGDKYISIPAHEYAIKLRVIRHVNENAFNDVNAFEYKCTYVEKEYRSYNMEVLQCSMLIKEVMRGVMRVYIGPVTNKSLTDVVILDDYDNALLEIEHDLVIHRPELNCKRMVIDIS